MIIIQTDPCLSFYVVLTGFSFVRHTIYYYIMLHICNGRVGEDNDVGHFTFTDTNGNSVIDYAFCSNNYTYLVDKFKIDERTESSHFPVCVGLKCQTSTDTFGTDVTSKGPQCKYFFNDNSTLTY